MLKQISQEDKDFSLKILGGVRKAYRKLVEETAARNGSLVVERDGKVVQVPAKKLLQELNDKK